MKNREDKKITLREHYVFHGTCARGAEDIGVTPNLYQLWLSEKVKPGWDSVQKLLRKGVSIHAFPD